MTLRTGEDILIWRRRLWIALCGGIVLEEALDLSSDRILNEWILGGLNLLGITCWLEKSDIKISVLMALYFVWVYFMHDFMCETKCLIYVVKCVAGDRHQGWTRKSLWFREKCTGQQQCFRRTIPAGGNIMFMWDWVPDRKAYADKRC